MRLQEPELSCPDHLPHAPQTAELQVHTSQPGAGGLGSPRSSPGTAGLTGPEAGCADSGLGQPSDFQLRGPPFHRCRPTHGPECRETPAGPSQQRRATSRVALSALLRRKSPRPRPPAEHRDVCDSCSSPPALQCGPWTFLGHRRLHQGISSAGRSRRDEGITPNSRGRSGPAKSPD